MLKLTSPIIFLKTRRETQILFLRSFGGVGTIMRPSHLGLLVTIYSLTIVLELTKNLQLNLKVFNFSTLLFFYNGFLIIGTAIKTLLFIALYCHYMMIKILLAAEPKLIMLYFEGSDGCVRGVSGESGGGKKLGVWWSTPKDPRPTQRDHKKIMKIMLS